MEPTSDPDNTRQSRGLARFWPVHGMPAPAQRQSEEDLDAPEGADGAAAAHASDQLAGVAGPTGEHPQVSDRQSQPQDEQHPADEPASGPFAPARPHPSLTSDTQMVALGSRRPADALLGGANGSRWGNQGGFPPETNGHRNGEAVPRHGGAPVGSGPVGNGPVGSGPVPGSRSPFAPSGEDAPFSPGQFLPQAHGSATVNGGNAQPPTGQTPVAQPPVAQPSANQPPIAQPPVAQRPVAQAPHPLAPIDLPAGPDLFTPAPQPPAGVRPVSGQPAAGSAQVPIPMTGRPVSAQPVSGQPTSGQPMSGQPMSGRPMSGQPMSGQPMSGQPMSGQPMSGQPMSGQPMSGQPMSGRPASDHPMSGRPVSGQPMSGQPMSGQPMSGQPMSGQPMSGQPWSGQPGSSLARSGQADVEQPPVIRPHAIPLETAVPTRLEPTGWATPSPLPAASGSAVVPAAAPSVGRRSRDDDPADTRVPAPRRSTSLDDVSAEPGGRRAARAAAPDAENPLRPGDLHESPITFWEEAASEQFRAEWHEIKAQFVDDPVTALTRAHDLLTEAVHELTESMLAERDELDPLRGKGTPDTESMRMAMRGYREFLDRILTL